MIPHKYPLLMSCKEKTKKHPNSVSVLKFFDILETFYFFFSKQCNLLHKRLKEKNQPMLSNCESSMLNSHFCEIMKIFKEKPKYIHIH